MSDHLEVFDTTLAETHVWLKAVAAELSPCNQHQAYQVLRATLHGLRDRLSPEAAINFSAQLPMLLRGVFTEGWRPALTPTKDHHVAEFLSRIEMALPETFAIETESAVTGVLRALAGLMDEALLVKVLRQLPVPLRALWPQSLARL